MASTDLFFSQTMARHQVINLMKGTWWKVAIWNAYPVYKKDFGGVGYSAVLYFQDGVWVAKSSEQVELTSGWKTTLLGSGTPPAQAAAASHCEILEANYDFNGCSWVVLWGEVNLQVYHRGESLLGLCDDQIAELQELKDHCAEALCSLEMFLVLLYHF